MAKATADTSKVPSAPKQSSPSKPARAERPGVFARLGQYFRDVRSEMRRVVWPTREVVINSSVVVIVTLVFFIAFTLLIDSGVIQLLGAINKF